MTISVLNLDSNDNNFESLMKRYSKIVDMTVNDEVSKCFHFLSRAIA